MSTRRSKVTAQGQISVPAKLRYTSEEIHRALFPTPPDPRTLDEMKEGIRRHLRAKHARR